MYRITVKLLLPKQIYLKIRDQIPLEKILPRTNQPSELMDIDGTFKLQFLFNLKQKVIFQLALHKSQIDLYFLSKLSFHHCTQDKLIIFSIDVENTTRKKNIINEFLQKLLIGIWETETGISSFSYINVQTNYKIIVIFEFSFFITSILNFHSKMFNK